MGRKLLVFNRFEAARAPQCHVQTQRTREVGATRLKLAQTRETGQLNLVLQPLAGSATSHEDWNWMSGRWQCLELIPPSAVRASCARWRGFLPSVQRLVPSVHGSSETG